MPDTFRFRFEDPVKLRAQLAEKYEDELTESLPCIDGGEWLNEDLVPIASVSKADNRVRPYEFAWVFFDWESSHEPRLFVTTTDYWGRKRSLPGLDSLKFAVTAE